MDKFLDLTIGNLISWILIAGSWVAMWQKTKDKVDNVVEQLKEQDKMLERIRDSGSPASKEALAVLASRIDSHNERIKRMEDALVAFGEIKSDVAWIKRSVQNMNGKS